MSNFDQLQQHSISKGDNEAGEQESLLFHNTYHAIPPDSDEANMPTTTSNFTFAPALEATKRVALPPPALPAQVVKWNITPPPPAASSLTVQHSKQERFSSLQHQLDFSTASVAPSAPFAAQQHPSNFPLPAEPSSSQQQASLSNTVPPSGGGGGSVAKTSIPFSSLLSAKKEGATLRVPKRTTKTSQKLTLFPDDAAAAAAKDEAAASTVQSVPLLLETFLSRSERSWLPRVTAYVTASSYKMDALMDFLTSAYPHYQTMPKKYDEVIYTPFRGKYIPSNTPKPFEDLIDFNANIHIPAAAASGDVLGVARSPRERSNFHLFPPIAATAINSSIPGHGHVGDHSSMANFLLQNVDSEGNSLTGDIPYTQLAKRIAPIGELFFFDYGVVVCWGLSEEEEEYVLTHLLPAFEEEKGPPSDIEVEEFHFHYNTAHQPRIYNDIITLKNPNNHMIKLTISHAVAQSVKLTLFEGLIETTIESTRAVPSVMAETGKIHMSRKQINMMIGQLFVMRINVNLISNVLDTPELFWSEPALEPLYIAIRNYLEILQRAELLNQRVSVISDLLDMLKDHQNSSHGEQLEWIVIILIAFEIIIGIITISFDLSSYLQHVNGVV